MEEQQTAQADQVQNQIAETQVDGGSQNDVKTELQQENVDATAAPKPDDTAHPDDHAQASNGLSKRFSELTRARREAEQRAAEAETQARLALETLQRVTGGYQPETQDEDQQLQEPTFETPEQYQRDMAQYTRQLAEKTARDMLKAQRLQDEQERIQRQQHEEQTRIRTSFQQRVSAARNEMPDYDDVAGNPDIPISIPLAAGIAQHPDGPKLAYHLGKNPAEAQRIFELPAPLQLMELGILASKLSQKPTPQTSKTPAPINPVRAGATPQRKSADEMSMEEYAESRRSL